MYISSKQFAPTPTTYDHRCDDDTERMTHPRVCSLQALECDSTAFICISLALHALGRTLAASLAACYLCVCSVLTMRRSLILCNILPLLRSSINVRVFIIQCSLSHWLLFIVVQCTMAIGIRIRHTRSHSRIEFSLSLARARSLAVWFGTQLVRTGDRHRTFMSRMLSGLTVSESWNWLSRTLAHTLLRLYMLNYRRARALFVCFLRCHDPNRRPFEKLHWEILLAIRMQRAHTHGPTGVGTRFPLRKSRSALCILYRPRYVEPPQHAAQNDGKAYRESLAESNDVRRQPSSMSRVCVRRRRRLSYHTLFDFQFQFNVRRV